jgi:hypothetical protein
MAAALFLAETIAAVYRPPGRRPERHLTFPAAIGANRLVHHSPLGPVIAELFLPAKPGPVVEVFLNAIN